ncbi:sigma-70 family RNA polymerase sigma factor [Oryzifoliimicrobium ureilyticus]|uniref:sigma-70 family RNA polymerase sigma factor n=1 Tax=Oryzifoliimicrobium ureilyticus TaxID=3113724 RepID=UPI0030760C7B
MAGNADPAELIARIALGDRAAFKSLYDVTSPKLFGICLRILKDRADAEEAVQEVYVRIWQRAGRFSEATGGATCWLGAIARNHAIDLLRARRPVHDELDEAIDVKEPALDPEQTALHRDDARRIDTCLQELEADRAAAVKMAYVDGLSYQELADRFAVPLNTMRTWLRRSLLKLRECMER